MNNSSPRNLSLLILLISLTLLSCSVATSGIDVAYPAIPDDCLLLGEDDVPVPVSREVYNNGQIFDISHRYVPDMPSYGLKDRFGKFLWLGMSMKNGSLANVSMMKFSVHSGTHVDAPSHVFDHYYNAGFDVDALDLHVLNGPALVVDVPKDKNKTAEVMKALNIPIGVRRVLFRTSNTDRKLMWKTEFDTSYVGFMKDGAKWLVENTDIKLVGLDYLNVAAWDEGIQTHHVFSRTKVFEKLLMRWFQEIIILEGLKLDGVPAGIYSVHCLPLRLIGADGSPTRCILIK